MNDIERAAPRMAATSQATVIEQTRAAAEVAAAVQVAQQCPRNIDLALDQMRQSCSVMGLAERAFYSYRRGGAEVAGATVHLARELARTWGNVQYGVSELRRDDMAGESEMQAWAWDVQTNSRSVLTFIVPHRRDAGGRQRQLTDLRDIYENNANMGARRLREVIFSILPPWFTEEAKDICAKTLAQGGGVPLPKRIADAIATYGREGVSLAQLETKLGKPQARWDDQDVARLRVLAQSIARGETTKDAEFAAPPVTAAEITGQSAPADNPMHYEPDEIAEGSR